MPTAGRMSPRMPSMKLPSPSTRAVDKRGGIATVDAPRLAAHDRALEVRRDKRPLAGVILGAKRTPARFVEVEVDARPAPTPPLGALLRNQAQAHQLRNDGRDRRPAQAERSCHGRTGARSSGTDNREHGLDIDRVGDRGGSCALPRPIHAGVPECNGRLLAHVDGLRALPRAHALAPASGDGDGRTIRRGDETCDRLRPADDRGLCRGAAIAGHQIGVMRLRQPRRRPRPREPATGKVRHLRKPDHLL